MSIPLNRVIKNENEEEADTMIFSQDNPKAVSLMSALSFTFNQVYAPLLAQVNAGIARQNVVVWCIHGPKGVGKRWLAAQMVRLIHAVDLHKRTHSMSDESTSDESSLFPLSQTLDSYSPHGDRRMPLYDRWQDAHSTDAPLNPDDLWQRETPNMDDVRDLLQRLHLKPCSANGPRTVVLCDVHTWNASCLNAMLKILETPPARTTFILTTARRLPATIQSRCHRVAMPPLAWHPNQSTQGPQPPLPSWSTEGLVDWLSQGCVQRQTFWSTHAQWAQTGWNLLQSCKTGPGSGELPSASWLEEAESLEEAWWHLLYIWGHSHYRWAYDHGVLWQWDVFWTNLWAQIQDYVRLHADISVVTYAVVTRLQHFFAYYERQHGAKLGNTQKVGDQRNA